MTTNYGFRVCAKMSWYYCWSPQQPCKAYISPFITRKRRLRQIKQLVHDHNLESVRQPSPCSSSTTQSWTWHVAMVCKLLSTNLTLLPGVLPGILLASAAGKREVQFLDQTMPLFRSNLSSLPIILWVSLTQEKLSFPWKQAEHLFLNANGKSLL